jgi:hypothetical protein
VDCLLLEDFFLFFEDAEQQAQFKYMYPAIPRIKNPKANSKLRLLAKLDKSSLSNPRAKAEEMLANETKTDKMDIM